MNDKRSDIRLARSGASDRREVDWEPLLQLVDLWERRTADLRERHDLRAEIYDTCAAQLEAAIRTVRDGTRGDTETGNLFEAEEDTEND